MSKFRNYKAEDCLPYDPSNPLEVARFRLANDKNATLNLFYIEIKPKNAGYEGYIHYKNLLLHTCWDINLPHLAEILIQRYEIINSVYETTNKRLMDFMSPKLKIDYEKYNAYQHQSGYIIITTFEEIKTNTTSDSYRARPFESKKLDWDVIFMYEQKIEILE